MMAWASGVWRAISSSVISGDMPFMLGKSKRVARPIPKKSYPGPWPITVQLTFNVSLFGGSLDLHLTDQHHPQNKPIAWMPTIINRIRLERRNGSDWFADLVFGS